MQSEKKPYQKRRDYIKTCIKDVSEETLDTIINYEIICDKIQKRLHNGPLCMLVCVEEDELNYEVYTLCISKKEVEKFKCYLDKAQITYDIYDDEKELSEKYENQRKKSEIQDINEYKEYLKLAKEFADLNDYTLTLDKYVQERRTYKRDLMKRVIQIIDNYYLDENSEFRKLAGNRIEIFITEQSYILTRCAGSFECYRKDEYYRKTLLDPYKD